MKSSVSRQEVVKEDGATSGDFVAAASQAQQTLLALKGEGEFGWGELEDDEVDALATAVGTHIAELGAVYDDLEMEALCRENLAAEIERMAAEGFDFYDLTAEQWSVARVEVREREAAIALRQHDAFHGPRKRRLEVIDRYEELLGVPWSEATTAQKTAALDQLEAEEQQRRDAIGAAMLADLDAEVEGVVEDVFEDSKPEAPEAREEVGT